MISLLYMAFLFFLIALVLAVLGNKVGLGGSQMAYNIAIIFVILAVVFFILSLFGMSGGISGGGVTI